MSRGMFGRCLPTGASLTNVIVGLIIGLPLVLAGFYLTGPRWGTFIAVLCLYEGWTLVNSDVEDTLSEGVWRLSERPLVPWLFGVVSGIGVASGYVSDPYVIAAIFFVQGHFFFSRYESK